MSTTEKSQLPAMNEKPTKKQDESLPMFFAGVDDGYAITKAVTAAGEFYVPSNVKAGMYGLTSMGDSAQTKTYGFETEGLHYTVSEYIEGEETRFNDYPFSPISRVIVHDVLTRAGLGGKNVIIATGLPISAYYEGSLPNQAAIESKRKNLSVPVSSLGGQCAMIMENHVYAEGVSAWVDHILDMEGNPLTPEVMKDPVGVVDIGGRTTDCAVILPPGNVVDPARKGSGAIGVMDIYDAIESRLKANPKLMAGDHISRREIRQTSVTKTFTTFGQMHEVDQIVEDAISAVLPRIEREIVRRIGSGADLRKIIFVGGGANLMRNQILARFPNAIIPDRAEFANARGMYKMLVRKHAASKLSS